MMMIYYSSSQLGNYAKEWYVGKPLPEKHNPLTVVHIEATDRELLYLRLRFPVLNQDYRVLSYNPEGLEMEDAKELNIYGNLARFVAGNLL